jgi:hypothetical protein
LLVHRRDVRQSDSGGHTVESRKAGLAEWVRDRLVVEPVEDRLTVGQ